MKQQNIYKRIQLWKLVLLIFGLFATEIQAQEVVVKGQVKSDSGDPLVGVSVVVKGTSNGTMTNFDGNFTINANSNSTLIFSFIGMSTLELEVSKNDFSSVIMTESNLALDEIIVTGYQSQRKSDLTGAISVVDVDVLGETPTGNALKALQGRVAGVYIQTDGNPNGGLGITIRGGSTLGNNNPLYVIDGVPTDGGIELLNPNDIESMQVLKDAASASIYGSRASNGVILITTRRGKQGKNNLEVSSYTTMQSYLTRLEVLNSYERGFVNWQAAINDGLTPTSPVYRYNYSGSGQDAVLNDILFPEFIDPARTMRPADTKWIDEVSQQSIIQSYNVNFSNGSEKSTSLISLNLFDHDGIIQGTNSKKLSSRINNEYRFFDDRLKIGENLSISYVNNTEIPVGDVMYLALVQQPIVPVYSIDGGWGGPAPGMTDRQNPVRLIEQNKQNNSKTSRIFGNVYLDMELVKDLSFRTSYGIDYTQNYFKRLDYSYKSGFLISDINRNSTSQWHNLAWTWSNVLNYRLSKGKHNADIIVGSEAIKAEYESFYGSREGYIVEDPNYMYLSSGTENIQNGGFGAGNSLFSLFGKFNYSFDDKYLISATIRRDGSSRFGKENLYGIFPAVSTGWKLSEENFIKSNINSISNLKLRAGWGITGNQNINNEAIYSIYRTDYGIDPTWTYDSGTAYDISGSDTGTLPSGYRRIRLGNPILKWEEAEQFNVGLDFGIFNGSLYGSFDYFKKQTKDILIEPPYLAVLGEGGNQYLNGATLSNNGWEAILGYRKVNPNGLGIDIVANFSHFAREITYLPETVLTGYPGDPANGKSILGRSDFSMFGFIADGIFQNQEEVDNSAIQNGKGVGRIRYKDIGGLDSDGNFVYQPDGEVNELDRTWIGDSTPDLEFGFNTTLRYKQFDFNAFFQGVIGRDVYNEFKHLTDFTSIWQGTNYGARTLDAWSPTNTDSTIPMLTLTDKNNEARYSTYFIENGSYLKLRNVQLGYSVPDSSISKIGISKLRIYAQAQNILTIKDNKGSDKFTGVDPELPGFSYPIPASFSLGINISY
ncbi:MAG: SusC/RagA family TonB-linked outer membrane protein [Flavobacteriaceae bacterium]|jgi:TonB-linked SusC/RagA family outer membrane protein